MENGRRKRKDGRGGLGEGAEGWVGKGGEGR